MAQHTTDDDRQDDLRDWQIGATPQYDDNGEVVEDWAECGTCGFRWNDALITARTPAPSGRCPVEEEHDYDEDDDGYLLDLGSEDDDESGDGYTFREITLDHVRGINAEKPFDGPEWEGFDLDGTPVARIDWEALPPSQFHAYYLLVLRHLWTVIYRY